MERLEVMARRRLRDRDLDLAAAQLALARAPCELADDLEPDRIRQGLQNVTPSTAARSGASKVGSSSLFDTGRTIHVR
jgi:hypothetical protein